MVRFPRVHRALSSHSKATDAMHAHLLKTAYMLPAANSLLASYDPASAAKLFDQMPLRDHVSWTTIIGACQPAQAVALFRRMLLDPTIRVDGVVLVVLLRAAAALRSSSLGSSLHAMATRRGLLVEDVFVANSLLHMYSECLQLPSARKVFDSIPQRRKNVVSWNTMLSGLVHADRCAEALHLLHQSCSCSLEADATTLAVLLQLCKKLARPDGCTSLHALALRKLLLMASTPLLNALLDAYAKCGLVDHALRLFRRTPDRDVVTWSTVIAACAGSGRPREAIALFAAMAQSGQRPSSITMLSLLEACASRADMVASRCAHGVALRTGLSSDLPVGNAIVNMYGKCGHLAGSRRVFDAMPVKDALSWNSMIGALGMNGRASDALGLIREMERSVKPNAVTLLAALSACAHGGLLHHGVACLERLPSLQPAHLTCIADMLARSGDVESAATIACAAAGPAAWTAVLSACRTTRNQVYQEAARRVVELEPDNSAGYVLAAMDKRGMRLSMRERGLKVSAGYSVVHVAGQEHNFASWDGRHPQRVQVYAMLHLLHSHMMRKPQPPHELCNYSLCFKGKK